MQKLEVFGANKLKGQINISGSKNASLPILAATLLSSKSVYLNNLPKVKDIETMINLLQSLGSKTKFIEAAACQIPIVTTPIGNLDFQNDYVCLGKTNNDLANQIDYLKNENVRNDLGKKLKNEILKNYNANIEIKKVIKLYNELI